ncbi:DNA phosphorothioation system restriction enzyme [Oscillatoriales cyanobacterium LEGE 11467]|uniref:DNA phosphorothioation system restriction enzyme n=1 Tax=Zarconia navalis LEGE 11467 TaxID=1828826 RepID=A0A928VTW8_9CYAN|nr:DNA phosphorothioation system restriction enzyme [Zarconia navalis]MBE9040182.1 DNA phosphorothioation system restriction enzyme [Zarconia navalis LEGE 11467]
MVERGYTWTKIAGCPQIPPSIELRSYQQQAIESWFANRGRGTLKMATGSGKTIAALAIATELYRRISLQVLLVVCPYRHLVTQWGRECEKFGLEPLLAFESTRQWFDRLSTSLYTLRSGDRTFLTVITTNSTLMGDRFGSQLKYFPEKTLIIGDEAHNLGAPRLEASLPRHLGLRLALSATPERYFDEEGTDAVLDYFGPVLQPELTLADAIDRGALVPYRYYPIPVQLTDGESQVYAKLTRRIGWALMDREKNGHREGTPEDLTALLMQRSRLIGAAENKLTALRQLMATRRNTSHTLFYCSDGATNATGESQLDAVARILGREIGYRINTYTAETSPQEREQLRHRFESGQLQGLVAIRCLDEGVDIPAIQTAAILASSSNPRQFIQRRGRILRPHPGKKRATLFDFIVLPPELDRETWEVERNLLKKELKRFVEFADLAQNSGEARVQLLAMQQKYGLLDL